MPQTDPVKTETIKIRVDPKQKSDLEAAASRDGLSVSTWLRQLALRAADKANKKRS